MIGRELKIKGLIRETWGLGVYWENLGVHEMIGGGGIYALGESQRNLKSERVLRGCGGSGMEE